MSERPVDAALAQIWAALGHEPGMPELRFEAGGRLPSVFHVSDLASASVAAAGLACEAWVEAGGGPHGRVTVDWELASLWFQASLRPDGWMPAAAWDPIAGDYQGADGWIRLHTNAPHHRAAALRVLEVDGERELVQGAVARWQVEELEAAVVAAGGAAAAMRSLEAWREHPQGRAVAGEPLISFTQGEPADGGFQLPADWLPERPLGGIRVLDLTRVLAGPSATRTLAGWGAEVLRIDPPEWDEPAIVPELTVGKRCARLDLRDAAGRERFLELLSKADVLVHGYRSDALARLGLGEEVRSAARQGLIDVALDAYGWSGPWATRRGFDSLVQMSCGIAAAGGSAARGTAGGGDPTGPERPVPLPVQALDWATGWMMAAAALSGLKQRLVEGTGSRWRLSLARTAELLIGMGHQEQGLAEVRPREPEPEIEQTAWGPARRLKPPVMVGDTRMYWELPARQLGSDPPAWAGA